MSAEVVAAVAEAHRRDWAQVFAITAAFTRDLDPAEECAQDAYARALVVWETDGIPDRPGAWLTTTARNRDRDVRSRTCYQEALALTDNQVERDFLEARLREVQTHQR